MGVAAEGWIDTRSNDYLGFAALGVSRETEVHDLHVGAGASRLVSGSWPAHDALEVALAAWLGTEACLLFSSGYAANVGVLSALVGPGETVISDALNHASIIDGCRLSRARAVIVPHADLGALDRALADTTGVRWVVAESYYGMDGDSPDLRGIRASCDREGAGLIVDEAHAVGVFGPEGRGVCAEQGVVPDVLVGGLGKAFGGQGGFVATSQLFREWLWNRARSFVFSTGMSPLVSALTLDRLRAMQCAGAERSRLAELCSRLEAKLTAAGVMLPPGRRGPIFPIVFGSEAAVLRAARVAADARVICQPIRPPTVPPGGCRLRVILRATMTEAEVDQVGDGLIQAWRDAGLPSAGAAAPSDGQGAADKASVGVGLPGTILNADVTEAGSGTHGGASRRDEKPWDSAAAASGPVTSGPPKRLAAVPMDHAGEQSRGSGVQHPGMKPRRWLVLGVGTGIGKTYVARGLVSLARELGRPVAGLKPIETGFSAGDSGASDAVALEQASFHVKHPRPHPLYGFQDPVTPALAARRERRVIDLQHVRTWVDAAFALNVESQPEIVVETAGGVFSPLGDDLTNLDLVHAIGTGTWLLVASDRLGVLHDVLSTLHAMRSRARAPDAIVLSAPNTPDASTGTNASELRRMPEMPPIIELPRNSIAPLAALFDASDPPSVST